MLNGWINIWLNPSLNSLIFGLIVAKWMCPAFVYEFSKIIVFYFNVL